MINAYKYLLLRNPIPKALIMNITIRNITIDGTIISLDGSIESLVATRLKMTAINDVNIAVRNVII